MDLNRFSKTNMPHNVLAGCEPAERARRLQTRLFISKCRDREWQVRPEARMRRSRGCHCYLPVATGVGFEPCQEGTASLSQDSRKSVVSTQNSAQSKLNLVLEEH